MFRLYEKKYDSWWELCFASKKWNSLRILFFCILSSYHDLKKKKKKLDKNEVNYETCLKWISEFFLLYILRSYNDFSEKFQKFVTNFSTIFERVKFFFV